MSKIDANSVGNCVLCSPVLEDSGFVLDYCIYVLSFNTCGPTFYWGSVVRPSQTWCLFCWSIYCLRVLHVTTLSGFMLLCISIPMFHLYPYLYVSLLSSVPGRIPKITCGRSHGVVTPTSTTTTLLQPPVLQCCSAVVILKHRQINSLTTC